MALIPVTEALDHVLSGVKPLPPEFASLTEAHGRVLAADLKALRTQPPVERYAGAAHGYTMADTPAYDEAACERHFSELFALLGRALGR